MFSLNLKQIAEIVGGTVMGNPDTVVTHMSIDSRSIQSGDLFCAIVGQRVDGHSFIDAVYASGATGVLASKTFSGDGVIVPPVESHLDPVIIALGKIARHVRTHDNRYTVVGVTGSSGKTSTKDIIGQVLNHFAPTHAPTGSGNNELGLPLTLLNAPVGTEFLIAEMGMRALKQIEYLCEVALPTIGVVTNVGQAHIGELGSIENIAKAKSELPQALPQDGTAVLNLDNSYVAEMSVGLSCSVITYGLTDSADVHGFNVRISDQGTTQFSIRHNEEEVQVSLPLLGEHNVSNALAATAVGITVGMPLANIALALNSVKPLSRWRMERSEVQGITIINDAYNANPESMAAALKTLASFNSQGRTWAVLGEMAELGDQAMLAHDGIGRLAVRLNISQLVTVGENVRTMFLGANQEGSWDGESVWFPDFASACDYIVERVIPGDTILFKASRSQGFEVLAQKVEQQLNEKKL